MQEQCEAQGQNLLGEMESWLVWTYDDDLPDVGLGLCVLCACSSHGNLSKVCYLIGCKTQFGSVLAADRKR